MTDFFTFLIINHLISRSVCPLSLQLWPTLGGGGGDGVASGPRGRRAGSADRGKAAVQLPKRLAPPSEGSTGSFENYLIIFCISFRSIGEVKSHNHCVRVLFCLSVQ